MRNILLGIQFLYAGFCRIYRSSLYASGENGIYPIQHIDWKRKANILSFSIDYMFMKNEEKLALIERISKFSGVQDKLLADISYLKGISGTGMQMEKVTRKAVLK